MSRRVVVRLPSGKVKMEFADRIETTSVKPPENAMKPSPQPKHLGGGWYLLPDGRKVRKSQLEGD